MTSMLKVLSWPVRSPPPPPAFRACEPTRSVFSTRYGRRPGSLGGSGQFGAQAAQNLIFVLHLGELARDLGAEVDDVGERGTILALQPIDGRQTVLDFGEVFGRGMNSSGVIPHGRAHVFDADQRRLQRGQSILKFRLVTGEFLDLLASRPQSDAAVETFPSYSRSKAFIAAL